MKYLISAPTLKDATSISRNCKLKRNQWVYIPENPYYRYQHLAGHKVDKQHLIGYFSQQEITYLTAWEARNE